MRLDSHQRHLYSHTNHTYLHPKHLYSHRATTSMKWRPYSTQTLVHHHASASDVSEETYGALGICHRSYICTSQKYHLLCRMDSSYNLPHALLPLVGKHIYWGNIDTDTSSLGVSFDVFLADLWWENCIVHCLQVNFEAVSS